MQIESKWRSVRDAAGEPRAPGESAVVVGSGYYREYVNGRIYYRPGSEAVHVYGYIGERYTQLGGPQSWLGWPTSDEQDFAQGGRASTFEHGAIYWWSDTGAIDMGNIVVNYTGLHCFGETDNDQLSDSDEPYVLFGVIPPPTIVDGKASVETSAPGTRIYDDGDGVDAGESREDKIELYRGLPYGMSFSVTLMEHDFSDPNEYRGVVKASADQAAKGAALAAKEVPVVGPALAVVVAAVWDAVGDDVVTEVHGLLDTKDDNIDTKPVVITAKQMVTLARAKQRQNLQGIVWQLETPLLSGDGASYKAYFAIEEAAPPPPPPPAALPPAAWTSWFRISNGGGLKAPVTALTPRPGHIDLFVVGNDGGVYSTFHEAQGNWQDWFRIGVLSAPTQSPVTALATRPGHIDLFVVGADGYVHSTFHEAVGDWQPWFPIGYVGVAPHSNVAAVQPRPDHIDLFVVGSDAKVYSTFHEGPNDWVPWFPIHEMRAPLGSEITALVPRPGHIDLFAGGMDGGVYTTFFEGNGPWQPWTRIPGVDMLPGSPIAALALPTARVSLFVVDKNKKVLTADRLGASDWSSWSPVSNLRATPGTRVEVLATRLGHTDLFVVGTDGGVYSTYVEGNDYQWQPSFRVTNAVSTPGAAVTALVPRPGHVDLFVSGLDSGVYSAFHEAGAAAGPATSTTTTNADGVLTTRTTDAGGVLATRSAPAPNVDVNALAARGEAIANRDPLSVELRKRQPEGPVRRGFDIGMAAAEGQTAPGPGKQRTHDSLSRAEQIGFEVALAFSLDRNKYPELAAVGAAIAKADPSVAAARTADPDVLYWLGFDIATGIFGDPALGARGNTATGPGSLGRRDSLSAAGQRGFNAAVAFHLARNYRR